LPGIAVLQPSGAIAEYGLAARALNLDETHPRSTMTDGNGSSDDPKCLKKA
jgi:hypothetical protein